MASVKPRPGYGYEVRYIDPATGKRPSKTFKLKKDADAFRRKVEREIEDNVHVAAASASTVKEIWSKYRSIAEQRVRDGRLGATRLRWMENAFEKHILPNIGGKRFADMVPSDAEALYRSILAGGTLSPATARQTVQAMITMESFAYKIGAAKRTPLRIGASDLRGIKAEPIRTFTTDQVSGVLRHVLGPRRGVRRRNAAMIACFVHLAACCGLRSGEIRALTPDCIDFERGEIRIRRNLTRFLEIKGPKTAAGVRNVPLPTHIAEMLKAWQSTYATANEGGLLFTSLHNRPANTDYLQKAWRGVLKEVGLANDDGFHFHALRHFAASWWIDNGLPLPEVATLLGHSKVDMTLSIYAHSLVRPQSRSDQMNAMAARLTQFPAANDACVTQTLLSA